jgi:hypothetical protein
VQFDLSPTRRLANEKVLQSRAEYIGLISRSVERTFHIRKTSLLSFDEALPPTADSLRVFLSSAAVEDLTGLAASSPQLAA